MQKILIIAGPTASGKSARAVAEALARKGEVISVDSRQVYRGLDIGTEKITVDEMRGVPHHLLDIRNAGESYGAGDFVADAKQLIEEIANRGKLPILAGGTHFYFDALLKGLPAGAPINEKFRKELEQVSDGELFARIQAADPRRAAQLDPKNRRRVVRALEIINVHGKVPERGSEEDPRYESEWVLLDSADNLREQIEARLKQAFARGLITEVARVRSEIGDTRLNELGLEYKMVGEYLRHERTEASLLPALSAKLWQYARRQRAWLRKLHDELIAEEA